MSRRSKERTIGINVHLDDTVLNGGSDLSLGGTRSTVEDEETKKPQSISTFLSSYSTPRAGGREEEERTWGEGSQT